MRLIAPLLISLITLQLIAASALPVVVIRGHVGAVKRDFLIVWVEDVLQGSLPESGVIGVRIKRGGCSGTPQVDEVKVGDFVEVRGYLENVCCRPMIILECGDHYIRIVRKALEAKIKPLQGCNSEIPVGTNVTYVFFLNRDSNVTISLKESNGSEILYQGSLKEGLYAISRIEKPPTGDREICILAESNGDSSFYCCPYSVVLKKVARGEIYKNLTVKVLTEAGYPVRNAEVYVGGKLYGLTDRRGILATNITEGVHEVSVRSEYYETAEIKAKPGLTIIKVKVKAPEIGLKFVPDHLNGSGVARLIIEKLSGADISIRVRLEALGNLYVNTTDVAGIPPFNVTLRVKGTGKLVASYGNVTAVLSSELATTKGASTAPTSAGPATVTISTSMSHTSSYSSSPRPSPLTSTSAAAPAYSGLSIALPIIALAVITAAIVVTLRQAPSRPGSRSGSMSDESKPDQINETV